MTREQSAPNAQTMVREQAAVSSLKDDRSSGTETTAGITAGTTAGPTAGITADMKARRQSIRWNRKIFVCSPYRPKSKDPDVARQQLQDNITRARLACKYITSCGFLPLCPHLYFTGYLDDNDSFEREVGLALAQDWLLEADELWVFGDEITEGMQGELGTAHNWDIPIRYQSEPALTVISLMNVINGTDYEKEWRRKMEALDTEKKPRGTGNAAETDYGVAVDTGIHAQNEED